MELLLEISDEKMKELDIHDTRITFDQLQKKIVATKMDDCGNGEKHRLRQKNTG